MKEKVIIYNIRRSYVPFYIIFTFLLIISLYVDYDKNINPLKDYEMFKTILIVLAGNFLIFSIFLNKIILTNEFLIFDYYPWFVWRRKKFKVADIKNFYYHEGNRFIDIEIVLYSKNKSVNFTLWAFNYKSISELYSYIYNHPLNRLESNIE